MLITHKFGRIFYKDISRNSEFVKSKPMKGDISSIHKELYSRNVLKTDVPLAVIAEKSKNNSRDGVDIEFPDETATGGTKRDIMLIRGRSILTR